MSNYRYLELDSTFRDRNQWPYPSEFETLISQSGRKQKHNASDPVCNSYPIKTWTSNRVDANTSGLTVTGVVDSVGGTDNLAASSSRTTFIVTSTAGNLQQEYNYYKNLMITNTTITESQRIVEYTYLGTDTGGVNDRAKITVESSFGSTFAQGNAFSISDPTDFSNTSIPLLFIPAGRSGADAYRGYIVYNETRNEYRSVLSYDYETHLLTLDASSSPITGWTITDNYSIRREAPLLYTPIVAGSTTSQIILTVGSSVDDYYNNNFLRIRSTLYGNGTTSPESEARRIIDYDGATLTATVSPPFSSIPTPGDILEILEFSYDNMNPFVYTGSVTSQQEMTCYEIQLVNLLIPNKLIDSVYGSRIAFYPYIYVQLQNVSSAGAGLKNVIYSNNPSSVNMTFRVAITDVSNPVTNSFLTLSGGGMTQTIKFKPNDNLKMSIRLSDGELFKLRDSDYYSPSEPKLENQISALFALKRI